MFNKHFDRTARSLSPLQSNYNIILHQYENPSDEKFCQNLEKQLIESKTMLKNGYLKKYKRDFDIIKQPDSLEPPLGNKVRKFKAIQRDFDIITYETKNLPQNSQSRSAIKKQENETSQKDWSKSDVIKKDEILKDIQQQIHSFELQNQEKLDRLKSHIKRLQSPSQKSNNSEEKIQFFNQGVKVYEHQLPPMKNSRLGSPISQRLVSGQRLASPNGLAGQNNITQGQPTQDPKIPIPKPGYQLFRQEGNPKNKNTKNRIKTGGFKLDQYIQSM